MRKRWDAAEAHRACRALGLRSQVQPSAPYLLSLFCSWLSGQEAALTGGERRCPDRSEGVAGAEEACGRPARGRPGGCLRGSVCGSPSPAPGPSPRQPSLSSETKRSATFVPSVSLPSGSKTRCSEGRFGGILQYRAGKGAAVNAGCTGGEVVVTPSAQGQPPLEQPGQFPDHQVPPDFILPGSSAHGAVIREKCCCFRLAKTRLLSPDRSMADGQQEERTFVEESGHAPTLLQELFPELEGTSLLLPAQVGN